jgi:hypothetical protein
VALTLLLGSVVAGPALAATSPSQYPGTEDQIHSCFRDNFGQASANCGAGQTNDISDAKVVSETQDQVLMQVDYTFSARAVQNTDICSGDQTAMVTLDKADGGTLSLSKMSGVDP